MHETLTKRLRQNFTCFNGHCVAKSCVLLNAEFYISLSEKL